MPSAEIITIGTELLLGEKTDTNAPHIARFLRDEGLELHRKTSVDDDPQRIVGVIREARARADLIICTGGLGPTKDDPTRAAVAAASGRELEYRPELWAQVRAMFARYGVEPSENNRQQAFLPEGATALPNPVGTAPAFIVETEGCAIVALPGVPREMERILSDSVLPYLRARFVGRAVIRVRTLHTCGLGESVLDERIRDLEGLGNPDVGLAAHSGRVDVRITARGESEASAQALIDETEAELRRRLGRRIYGVDGETLAEKVIEAARERGWRLATVEAGTGGRLAGALDHAEDVFLAAELLGRAVLPDLDALCTAARELRDDRGADVVLGLGLVAVEEVEGAGEAEGRVGHFCLVGPEGEVKHSRKQGGHPDHAAERAVVQALDLLRGVMNERGR